MDSNTHSTEPAGRAWRRWPRELQELAAQDLDGLADAARAERVRGLRGLADRLEGLWLRELAAVDARGAAGAEQGLQAGSTAGWLRARLRMGAGAAATAVRTARALFGGPLTGTAQALVDGEISPGPCPGAGPRHPGAPRPPGRRGRTGAGGGGPAAGPAPAAAGRGPSPGGRSTPRVPRARPNASTCAGACGCRPPWRAWSRWTGCWRPRPARSCWPPWSRWPAPPTPTTPAAVANAGLMP